MYFFYKKLSIVLTALILTACATVNYDAQADQQLTAITQEINYQFISWETQASSTPVTYDKNFYDKVESDIKTLRIRLMASQDPATAKIAGVVDSLGEQVEQFRVFHAKSVTINSPNFFEGERQLLAVQLAALLTFELSLKPNSVSGSPAAKSTSASTASTIATAKTSQAAIAVNKQVHNNSIQFTSE